MLGDHFLDANILIGSRISWDRQYERVTRYMAMGGVKRHTSNRVYKESRGVFEGSRGLILKFLKKFYEEFSRSHDPLRVDQIISAFTKRFASSLEEKEQKILNSFVERNSREIRNVALGGETQFGEFRKEVIDTFKNAVNSIDKDCQPDSAALICRYDNCPAHYHTHYPGEYIRLCRLLNYEKDALVLMDSYFIKNNHIKNNVCFVTTDHEHILNNKTQIEGILNGISVMYPE